MSKTKVAFVCVHNSCRSQIAEALGKYLASDVFESYSAGTELKPQINQDAVRLMKQIYGIDMEKEQTSKLLADIPEVDIVITMGCNVNCPDLACSHREDWGLEDPSGKSDEDFLDTITAIESKIRNLKEIIQKTENKVDVVEKPLLNYQGTKNTTWSWYESPIYIYKFIDVKTGKHFTFWECLYAKEAAEAFRAPFYENITHATADFDILWKISEKQISPVAPTSEVQAEYQRMVNEGVEPDKINDAMMELYKVKAKGY